MSRPEGYREMFLSDYDAVTVGRFPETTVQGWRDSTVRKVLALYAADLDLTLDI